MVTIIIEKRHLFVFCIAVGLIIGGIFVYAYKANPDWTNSDPAKFGHSVDEMDWSQTINRDVSIGGVLSVGGQQIASSESSSIVLGDLIGGDGLKNLILRAGGQDRVFIDQGNGNVGIGVFPPSPTAKLDVNGRGTIRGNLEVYGNQTSWGMIDVQHSNISIYNGNLNIHYGNIVADFNTPGACNWFVYSGGGMSQDLTCGIAGFVAGLRINPSGFVTAIRCCEL